MLGRARARRLTHRALLAKVLAALGSPLLSRAPYPPPSAPFEMEACVGRFLLPDCKRKSNYEGLGSSLTFHRATVAYALLFNLTITSEPCARPQTSPFP